MKYIVHGMATVSCHTVVEANSHEEARAIAEQRQLAQLIHQPFASEDTEEWHIETDGDVAAISSQERP